YLLGDEAQDEFSTDRRDAGDERLPQIALDVKFLGVAEAAMGHHRLLAGVEPRFAGEIFRRIRRRPARQALVVLPAGLQRHQPRRFQFHPVPGERMLDRLILANRTIEDDARPGIATGARQREVAKANSFRGNQDALRIHAVQDVFETATLFAKTILDRYLEILEEQFVGIDRLAAHLLDLVHRD